jgi:protein-S-isoprenylcysteine O-methyltransferase Ste14
MPAWRLVVRSAFIQAAVLLLPFVAAGTIRWVRGWYWLGLQFLTLAVSLALILAKNPGLLRARMEHMRPLEAFDRIFSGFYLLSMAALLIVAGVDARQGWSHLSWGWLYFGIALQSLAVVPILAAACINPHLEGFVRIQNDRGHMVIASGVYSVVRHPMYAGVMLCVVAWPLIFGSAWAMIPAVLAILAFPFRAVNEERVLRQGLPGYEEYMRRTPYRLVPGLW